MLLDLSGKTALVTGSTQGIGRAIAAGLAGSGARVAVNGRTGQSVDTALERLSEGGAGGGDLIAAPGDISTDDGARAVFEAVPHVDILVNNLGVYAARPALEIDDAEWRHYFDVNVLTAVRMTRHYMPGMMDRSWGRIQYIASDSSVVTPVDMIHYGMTKTALLAVSRGFAKEAAGTGVTVNSVLAGPTDTRGARDFIHARMGHDRPWEETQREFMRMHRPQSLLQRLIRPEEIAHMVVYLSSPFASATTGGALRVDGGYTDSIIP